MGIATTTIKDFHVPDNADDCRVYLAKKYPEDRTKYNKMPARQVKAIFRSVRAKEMTGHWHPGGR